MRNPFAKEDAAWAARDTVTGDNAVKLVADQTAVAISKYCRMESYNGDYDDEEEEKYEKEYKRAPNGYGYYVYAINGARIQDIDGNRIWPNGKPMRDNKNKRIDEEGNLIPEYVSPGGKKEVLTSSLAEIKVYADKNNIPFSPEVAFLIGQSVNDKNDDVWRNSSIGC